MRRKKKAMTRTELPVALHVVFQQHSFPVTRILVLGPKHTDGKFFFNAQTTPATRRQMHTGIRSKHCWTSNMDLQAMQVWCQESVRKFQECQERVKKCLKPNNPQYHH